MNILMLCILFECHNRQDKREATYHYVNGQYLVTTLSETQDLNLIRKGQLENLLEANAYYRRCTIET